MKKSNFINQNPVGVAVTITTPPVFSWVNASSQAPEYSYPDSSLGLVLKINSAKEFDCTAGINRLKKLLT